jgi:hypothetical protein
MKIPKKFKLFDHTIEVIYNNTIKGDSGDELFGNTDSNFNKIRLAKKLKNEKGKSINIPRSQIEHTFCHELVHTILCLMGEDKLNKNEKFVDNFAGFLHQYMNTKKVK